MKRKSKRKNIKNSLKEKRSFGSEVSHLGISFLSEIETAFICVSSRKSSSDNFYVNFEINIESREN